MDTLATIIVCALGLVTVTLVAFPQLGADRMRVVFWASVGALLVGITGDPSGLLCLLVVVLWCCIWMWRLGRTWRLVLPVVCLTGMITGFSQGYKVWGAAMVVDNGPLLERAFVPAHLEYPNIVVATDGSRHRVSGFEFKAEVFQLPPGELMSMIEGHFGRLGFRPDAASPSGYVAEQRIDYTCGNTFFPTFLPERLPRYRVEDLAVTLGKLGVRR